MTKLLNNLYNRYGELYFSITVYVIYILSFTIMNFIDSLIPIPFIGTIIVSILIVYVLFSWMKTNYFFSRYKFRLTNIKAKYFLFYIPLIFVTFISLSLGIRIYFSPLFFILFTIYLILDTLIIETIRAFLFNAIKKSNENVAIVICSLLTCFPDILNLFDVSSPLLSSLFSMIIAASMGFLYVTLYNRGNSIYPVLLCAFLSSLTQVFTPVDVSTLKLVLISIAQIIIAVCYALILTKTLPKSTEEKPNKPWQIVQ